jgi:hypothetical protein
MAKNVQEIANLLGAEIKSTLPDVGGGAFGAARLAHLVASLRARLHPGQGRRPGRPSDARWVRHPKVPMSAETEEKLRRMAERASTPERQISPMQIGAQLLEEAVAGYPEP